MVRKTPLSSGRKPKVTFEVAPAGHSSIAVVGDFNHWDKNATPLKLRKKDGLFAASVTLDAGRRHEFRYCADGSDWFNDPDADATVPNGFGGENSVLQT